MENHHFSWVNQLKMAIFNSYVSLPEGIINWLFIRYFWITSSDVFLRPSRPSQRRGATAIGCIQRWEFFFRFSHMQGGFNERIKQLYIQKYYNKSNNTNNDHSNENNPKKQGDFPQVRLWDLKSEKRTDFGHFGCPIFGNICKVLVVIAAGKHAITPFIEVLQLSHISGKFYFLEFSMIMLSMWLYIYIVYGYPTILGLYI